MEGDPVIDGTPFSKLMDQAVKLRTHSHAPLRSKFDKWPRWYQNSMFTREDIDKDRALPFPGRIEAFQKRKEAGQDHMQKQDFLQAANELECAVGIFKYLHNTNPGWKKKGIYDEQIEEVDNLGSNEEERNQAREAMVDVLLILTHVYEASKERQAALDACDSAISLVPTAAQAYLRRAQVRVAPVSAGATEQDIAIKDLQQASQLDPRNQEIREMLRELKLSRKRQMERDKKTFAGMFERGTIVKESELKKLQQQKKEQAAELEKKKASEQKDLTMDGMDLQAQIQAATKLAKECKKEGRMEDYRILKDHVKNAKTILKRRKAGVSANSPGSAPPTSNAPPPKTDFRNPTKEMVEEAKKQGIDLTDEKVVEMLEQLQEETSGKEKIEDIDVNANVQNENSFNPSPALIEKTIRGMPPGEIRDMLVREGGMDSAQLVRMSDDEVKDFAVGLYAKETFSNHPDSRRPKGSGKGRKLNKSPSSAVWAFSFTIAGLAFLYRMYTSGLLFWFLEYYGFKSTKEELDDYDNEEYNYFDENSDDYDY